MTPAAFHFCTYFDHHYLVRGLALIQSLEAHCPPFTIWVLCLDEGTFRILTQMNLPAVRAMHLTDFENANPELLTVKPQRTALEYYFTCTPFLPRFVLNRNPEMEMITYLDADLYFFDDPRPLFEELGTGSIGIVPQRYPPASQADSAQFGLFNVAWVTFRRDAVGLACLRWWGERCIEWCHLRSEDGKFGDQKYLDDWPARFSGVVVLIHKGADVARWNVANCNLTQGEDRQIYVDGQPLIFYHFSGLTQIRRWLYNPRFHSNVKPVRMLRRQIYGPYLDALGCLERQVRDAAKVAALDDGAWQRMRRPTVGRNRNTSSQLHQLLRLCRLAIGIATGRLLICFRGKVM